MDTVRSAHEQDVPLLSAIGFAAWELAVAGLVDSAAMGRVAQLSFLSFIRQNWMFVRVVDSGGTVAGWAARENGDGDISDIWIAPAFQRKGLGTLLLRDIEIGILADGHDTASMKTHAQNAQAIAFFRKHDYAIHWLLTTYSPKLDRNVDSVGMLKTLRASAPLVQNQGWF